MHVETSLRDDAIGIVELTPWRWVMSPVWMMKDFTGKVLILLTASSACRGHWVSRLVEPDMTVADLQERQSARFRGKSPRR
jgi:hypothetical protein